jgi:predicted transcriptional regulator
MNKSQTTTLSFRAPSDSAARLDALADATDRPRSWLLEQALEQYLEIQAWQIGHIAEGLADVEAGRLVDHETVMADLERWAAIDGEGNGAK